MRPWHLVPILTLACAPGPDVAATPSDDALDDTAPASVDTDDGVGDPVDTAAFGDTGEVTSGCDPTIVSTSPEMEDDEVFPVPVLSATFTGDERPHARFSLTRAGGGAVVPLSTPRWSDQGRRVWVEPLVPLEPEAEYTWTVSASCATVEAATFTTSDVGAAVDDVDLEARTWVLAPSGFEIISPPGLDVMIQPVLAAFGERLAIRAHDVDAGAGELALDIGTVTRSSGGYDQDPCLPTLRLGDVDYAGAPFFEAAADSFALPFGGAPFLLHDGVIRAGFGPQGDELAGFTVRGALDTRGLGDLIAPGSGAYAVCDLIALFSGFRVLCDACPDGSGDTCLDVVMVGGQGPASEPFALQHHDPLDILEDPNCMLPMP